MMEKIPMTAAGHAALESELKRRTAEERPRIIELISEARGHGDLSENAEYHAARDQQGLMEARIRDIEGKLSNCQVINPAELNAGGKVVFGATVEIVDEDSRDETTYQIVGEDEADIKAGRISYRSPIARALIGEL